MLHLFFDLETTSMYPTNADILEAAYIVVDDDLNPLEMYDKYYAIEREVPQGASAKTKLTRAKLDFLSDGREFFMGAEDLRARLMREGYILHGYNSATYDIPVLNRNLTNAGVDALADYVHEDVFHMAKRAKLNTPNNQLETVYNHALEKLGTNRTGGEQIYLKWAKQFGMENARVGAHGALYDSFMTAINYFYLKSLEVE